MKDMMEIQEQLSFSMTHCRLLRARGISLNLATLGLTLKLKYRLVGRSRRSQAVIHPETARTGQIQLAILQQEMERRGAFAMEASDGMA